MATAHALASRASVPHLSGGNSTSPHCIRGCESLGLSTECSGLSRAQETLDKSHPPRQHRSSCTIPSSLLLSLASSHLEMAWRVARRKPSLMLQPQARGLGSQSFHCVLGMVVAPRQPQVHGDMRNVHCTVTMDHCCSPLYSVSPRVNRKSTRWGGVVSEPET